jgi:ubiquitin-protein ligase
MKPTSISKYDVMMSSPIAYPFSPPKCVTNLSYLYLIAHSL